MLEEIGNKMRRRHMIQALELFYVRKVQENLALVEYPHLSGWSEVDLNLCANDLM